MSRGMVTMARGDGGYMRVVAGMPDPKDRLPPSAGRRLKEDERRALVARLRGQGWSYRRISDELNISYAVVSRWLDGPESVGAPLPSLPARFEAPRLPVVQPPGRALAHRSESESPPPILEHLIAQNRALIQRVDQLVAAETARNQALDDLELRLAATIEDQNRKLGDRLIESVKSLFRKFLSR